MTVKMKKHPLVRVDQVMQLYSTLPTAAAATLILATILLFTQRPVINHTILYAWWGTIAAVTILRILLVIWFRRTAQAPADIETWAARFLAGSFLAGLTWGAAGFLLIPEQGMLHQLIVIFTIAGLGSAAVSTLGSEWDNISYFLCAMLAPTVLRFLFIGGAVFLMMAVMGLTYLVAMLLIARSIHNTILEVLTLRTADIQQESRLLESEEKYRNVVERSNDGIGIIQDGQLKYANEPLASMAGYTVAEMIGTPFSDYFHPDELPLVADRYRRRMAGEEVPQIYETVGKHKDGRNILMEINVGLIPYHNKPAELVIVRDITERKQAEDALRGSEDRYRALFNHASDYIFIVDPTHEETPIITDVNEYACRKHGYTREELIGQPYSIINDEESQDEITDKTMRILAGEILNFESQHVHKDGRQFPVEVSARLITIKEKPVMITIVRDITERKQAEERIKTALREKEILLKEIHHRVKNNLQVISSLLSLQSKYTKDQAVVDAFRNSQERIRVMAIAHEKLYQSPDLSRIDFCDYLGSLTTYLFESHSFKPGQVQLKTEIEDTFINLETAIPLGLIINELVANSLKHAFPDRRKGELHIQFRENKGKDFDYSLVIRDNGVGIHGKIDSMERGSLGMVLVNTLVKQLHGVIEHETNKGTCFTIKFKKIER
ncbi:MAG: PAS domain S-box protein [Candidatus Aminicenantes bacterium]|nr:PAS domain S-box protein [Candidatus Aminicenantes bacterium]